MNDELKKKISSLSDEEIVRIVYTDSTDYREEAISYAKEELKRRKLDKPNGEKNEEKTKEVAEKRIKGKGVILKVWFKYVLVTAILINMLTAIQLGNMYRHLTHGDISLEVGIIHLAILLFFGLVFGTIYFGIAFLLTGKTKMRMKKPTHLLGLFILVILLVLLSNLLTVFLANFMILLIIGIYWLVRLLKKKTKPT
jgi:hypothetical protein